MSGLREGEDCINGDREMRSITSYFSRLRSLALNDSVSSKSASSLNGISQKPVLVMGNPSADLDSFISAVVTSFCYNLAGNEAAHTRKTTYIPILNLPSVGSSELWRLRPEFGVAVRLALGESPDTVGKEGREQGKTDALRELITIADIKADEGSSLYKLFTADSNDSEPQHPDPTTGKQPLFLVDHNSPSIPGLSDEAISARFTVTGCIDHHVDENYVGPDADPRIVTTGIGSCTSLVVTHLRERGMWPTTSSTRQTQEQQTPSPPPPPSPPHVDPEVLQQISKLALAPILIDTWNLRATGDKCSDTDREVVRFLESVIAATAVHTEAPSQPPAAAAKWDGRDAFFSCIATAKADSLDLLTMQEVFGRDYKVWTERPSGSGESKEINIGISSLVKPLSWLVSHAGRESEGPARSGNAVDAFLSEVTAFATDPARQLGVFCLLTRTGDGRKEVAVLVLDEDVKAAVDAFEARSRDELRLSDWTAATEDGTSTRNSNSGDGGDKEKEAGEEEAQVKGLTEALTKTFGDKGQWKIWWMGDTSKSRKQVGPLLREAVRDL
ncbi:hypothetical protein AYL99_03905 [Fonsecaea erecta]|uniref:DHHA2 domain-containing protein n=1 Tax=Fonsecaea erecta TaxID=1367422 RepID=A0A178ZPY1_9EURO|nr:hypothetical protein AYL99_03905 [Fonsecaea erecta]OAP61702.1 hypothetical protein AYL99_03905 [Fonsecaea erecta]